MIELRNVSRSFTLNDGKEVPILNNVNLIFPDTGLYFILGKSGSGKTTLLTILETILQPSSGEIFYNGQAITGENAERYRNEVIGILFQNFNLINSITVAENLEIIKEVKNAKDFNIDEALKSFGLEKLKDRVVNNLSGGEKQRVALVRALISNPKVILCDEPTGAIDEENGEIVINELRRLSEDRLVIIVTHNKNLIREEDNIIEIKDGNVKRNYDNEPEIIEQENYKKPRFSDKNPAKLKYFFKILTKRLFNMSALKNLLFIISLTISLLSLSLSASLKYGVEGQEYELPLTFLNYQVFDISEIESYAIADSIISASQLFRPSYESVEQNFTFLESFTIEYNLEYFLSGDISIKINDNRITFASVDFYYEDSAMGIIVNDLFVDYYIEYYGSHPLYETIDLTLGQTYAYSGVNNLDEYQQVYETFSYENSFYITEVVEEFSYLNVPKIYLPYYQLLDYVQTKTTSEINREFIANYTRYDMLVNAGSSEAITGYSMKMIVGDDSEVVFMYQFIDAFSGDTIQITNEGYMITSSFFELTNILMLGLTMFSVISIIITFALLLFIIISIYLSERKEIAILLSLGTRNKDIRSIFMKLTLSNTIISIIFGLIFTTLISLTVNKIVSAKFNIGKILAIIFVDDFDLTCLYLLMIIAITVFVYIFTYFVLRKRKNIDLALELKEE